MGSDPSTWSPVLSLHKYFMWSQTMRLTFLKFVADNPSLPDKEWYDSRVLQVFAYMSYWYSGLYVVIEGWKRLSLTDPAVDPLLLSPTVELLRLFRNGSLHFQEAYFDKRFVGFMALGQESSKWAEQLSDRFSEFFIRWYETHNAAGGPKQV
jgi:hypothetical protein